MLPFCPLGAQIQVGWHCQAEQADRMLARPVQKIKAGQLALMPALFFGDWRAWRTAGLLFCPVLQLPFFGCTNSSSFMVWLENQHSAYMLVHKIGTMDRKNTSMYIKILLKRKKETNNKKQEDNALLHRMIHSLCFGEIYFAYKKNSLYTSVIYTPGYFVWTAPLRAVWVFMRVYFILVLPAGDKLTLTNLISVCLTLTDLWAVSLWILSVTDS